METRAHHVLIGLFTLALAAGAMLFALWLTSASTGGTHRTYGILFHEPVTGLSRGSPVHYSGIRVGEVTELRLDDRDPRKVRARIRIGGDTPVTEATRARLAIANITGAAVIQLISGPPDSPPLTAEGGEVPVIEADPSPLAQLRSNSEELLLRVNRFMENANRLLSGENAGRITAILANLETATGAVADREDAIRSGLGELPGTVQQLNRTLARTEALVARVDRSFAAHGPEMFANADRTLTSLRQLSDNLDRLVAANGDSLGASVRNLEPAIRDLRRTLSTLDRLTRRLEDAPMDYLLGGEQMEEYQP